MDNVTHTLFGIAIARTPKRWEPSVFWASVLGSNFPDLDFLIPKAIEGGNLGYLLYHRGHTHTLVWTLPIAAVCAVLALGMTRSSFQLKAFWKPFAFAWLASLLHILLDFTNEYGVHPFYPFSNRWFYGDSIFIIEPFLLYSLLPLAVWECKAKMARVIWGVISIALLGLVFLGGFLLPAFSWAVLVFALLIFALQKKFPGWKVPVASMVAVYTVFFTASALARKQTSDWILQHAATETFVQKIQSPAPANPFCWRVILVSHQPGLGDEKDQYRLRLGTLSLWPGMTDPALCHARTRADRTAPLVEVGPSLGVLTEPRWNWLGEFRAPVSEMKAIAQQYCRFRALLKFTRAPFWTRTEQGWVAGDLRYDREPGLGFSEIELKQEKNEEENCFKEIPWVSPVQDIVSQGR